MLSNIATPEVRYGPPRIPGLRPRLRYLAPLVLLLARLEATFTGLQQCENLSNQKQRAGDQDGAGQSSGVVERIGHRIERRPGNTGRKRRIDFGGRSCTLIARRDDQ